MYEQQSSLESPERRRMDLANDKNSAVLMVEVKKSTVFYYSKQ